MRPGAGLGTSRPGHSPSLVTCWYMILGELLIPLRCHILSVKQGGWTDTVVFQQRLVVWHITHILVWRFWAILLGVRLLPQSICVQWELCLTDVCPMKPVWKQEEGDNHQPRDSLKPLSTLRCCYYRVLAIDLLGLHLQMNINAVGPTSLLEVKEDH